MTIKAWRNFGKKSNSTEIPVESTNTVTFNNVRLKENTSILTPVIQLQRSNLTTSDITYVKMGDRYYFVTDMVYCERDIVEYHLEVDALASHREEILEYDGYIERTDDEHLINPWISDGVIPTSCYKPMTQGPESTYVNNTFSLYSNDTMYCIGFDLPIRKVTYPSEGVVVIGDPDPINAIIKGTSSYVMMNFTQFNAFLRRDVDADYNIYDHIISCVALPTKPTNGIGEQVSGALRWGNHNEIFVFTSRQPNENSWYVDEAGIMPWFTVNTFDNTHQINGRLLVQTPNVEHKTYKDYPPFLSRHINAGVFGNIELPAEESIINSNLSGNVSAIISVDVTNGDAILSLHHYLSGVLIGRYPGKLGVECPVKNYSNIGMSEMLSLISKGLTVATGGIISSLTGNVVGLAGSVAGAASLAGDVYNSTIPKQHGLNVSGSTALNLTYSTMRIYQQTTIVSDNAQEIIGKPCYSVVSLIDVDTGSFVKLINPSFNLFTAYKSELDAVNSAFANGVYLW